METDVDPLKAPPFGVIVGVATVVFFELLPVVDAVLVLTRVGSVSV